MNIKSVLLISFAIILFTSCNQESQNTNADFAKTREFAGLWFHHSAEMEACYIQTYHWAEIMLDKQLTFLSEDSKKPAVVLDIDETVLDNSPYQFKLLELNAEYTSENWTEWVKLAKAKALPGSHEFISYATEKGVEVFYISNRKIEQLGATIKNLQNLNFSNADSAHVLLRDKTGNKTERRNTVSENHEIILFIGDNLSDFSHDFAKRSKETMGKEVVEKNKALFGEKYIVLPNPMYGEWEKTIYNNSRDWTDAQKDSLRVLVIESGY